MKNSIKKYIAGLLTLSILTGTMTALASPDVDLKINNDKTATVTIDGESHERIAIAQYDERGFLVNFGVSALNGKSATTEFLYNTNPYYKTKILTYSDWENAQTNDRAYQIGTRTFANETFEVPHNFQIARGENKLEPVAGVGVDGTTAFHFKNSNGNMTGGHATYRSAFSDWSDFMVYELDFKLNTAVNHFTAAIYTFGNDNKSGIEQQILRVLPNTTEGAVTESAIIGTGKSVTLNVGEYYHISACANYADGIVTCTLSKDGAELAAVTENLKSAIGTGAEDDRPFGLRISISNQYWNPVITYQDFYVDNVRIYEGTSPREDLNEMIYEIDTESPYSIFESEDTEIAKLSGTLGVHARSGVAYKGTEKTILNNKPYIENHEVYVPYAELCKVWGVAATGVKVDANGYANLNDIADAMGKILYRDVDATYNEGMCVIADSFRFPTDATELQELNDYMFFLRPDAEDIKEAYKASTSYQKHPRVMADAEDFANMMRKYCDSDDIAYMNWSKEVLDYANGILECEKGSSTYTKRYEYSYTNGRISSAVSWCQWTAAIMSMAYRLTNNTEYVTKMYEILETIGNYTNWNPNHHLDPAQISLGFSITYDWCYDALTPEQRAFIEKTVYEKLFYDSAIAYQTTGAAMNNFGLDDSNHSQVCNGGIAVAAMAFMDVYPEECAYLLENAIRSTEKPISKWAPDGSWYEGVGYWEFAMEYQVYLMSSLEATFGMMFGLESCDGLDTAAAFTINSQTQNGPHNYSDCGAESANKNMYTPEMLWLSKVYKDPDITKVVVKRMPKSHKEVDDNAYALIWYDTTVTGTDVDMPLDAIYEVDDNITMRNNWEQDSTSSYVGIHGGATNTNHSHIDGGSFVFEQGGVRWAIDLGAENYNVPNFWDTTYSTTTSNRWRYLRTMAEGHNTLVIDPDVKYTGHDLQSYVEVDLVETDQTGAIATADMTEALSRTTTSALRGFFYTDNRESLVIRDEITLRSGTHEIYWNMFTGEDNYGNIVVTDLIDVTIAEDGLSAELYHRKTAQTMVLTFEVTGGSAELTTQNAETVRQQLIDDGFIFDTSHLGSGNQASKETYKNRITLKVTGTEDVTITVKLTPKALEGASTVSEYNKPISEWRL